MSAIKLFLNENFSKFFNNKDTSRFPFLYSILICRQIVTRISKFRKFYFGYYPIPFIKNIRHLEKDLENNFDWFSKKNEDYQSEMLRDERRK